MSREGDAVDAEALRTIVEHTEDVLYMFDGVFDELVYVNRAYEEVWGGSIEELRRDPTAFLDLIHPDDREIAVASMEELAAGEPSEVEYRVVVDGEVRWVRVRSEPVVVDGEVERVVGWVQHVTEQKERERELERLSERYRTVYDNVQDGLFLIDVDGDAFRYADFNPRQESIVGMSTEEVAGMTPEELLDEEDAAAVRERYRECRDAGDTIAYEEELDLPAGTRTFHTRLSPVTTDGEVTQIVGVARDVTEQRERERRLRHQNEQLARYREIVETFDDIAFVADDDRQVTYVNSRVYDYFDVDEDAFEGRAVDVLADQYVAASDDPERLNGAMERAFSGDGADPERFELELDTDRGRRTFEYQLSPIRDDGVTVAVVGVLRDVTERVNRERELERQNERLEAFAGIVSHDLRNPLAILDGSLDVAEETGDPEQFERCRRAVTRMKGLVDDLLELARHGDVADDLRHVALAEAVEEAWETVENRGATLTVGTEAAVRADGDRLRQLLENLLRNAVEHGGEGVAVTVGDLPDGEGFFVADDGPGVPSSLDDGLFEAGASGDGGTGLGLAIVDQIAAAHGWRVAVEESESGGARFEIWTAADGTVG